MGGLNITDVLNILLYYSFLRRTELALSNLLQETNKIRENTVLKLTLVN